MDTPIWEGVCTCVHMHAEARDSHWVFVSIILHLMFETGFLTEYDIHRLGSLARH